jgi:hypothetical protein
VTYRVIYSLHIDLTPGPGGELRALIVPLRPDGTATNIEPLPPKTRAVDLRDGDPFVFQGRRETAAGIRAYRDSFTEVKPRTHREGYLYKVPQQRSTQPEKIVQEKPHQAT